MKGYFRGRGRPPYQHETYHGVLYICFSNVFRMLMMQEVVLPIKTCFACQR
jgi:hypothetical protein